MKKVRVFFETHGCAINNSDSETMKGILKQDGFEIVDKIESSDVIVLNSCTVKLPTFNRFKSLVKKYSSMPKKKLVIAGCVPQTNLNQLKDYSCIGVEQIKQIGHVVWETYEGNIIHMIERSKDPRLNLPKIRRFDFVEIVPISKGCLGNCSYCKVKFARGDLVSYNPAAIIRQIKSALNDGVKEIWLTAQDTGAYGLDINTNIVELLEKIIVIKGDFKIRLGMANPNFVYRFLSKFLKIFESEKMFRFLHIPLQSGSDKVLKDMRRAYTVKQFIECTDKLREKFPDITLATDIITGFPTETNEDFKKTISLVNKVKFDVINVSKYSSMDKTDASKMKQIASEIIKKRSSELTKSYTDNSFERNKFWQNWQGSVVIDEIGKNNTLIGRNYAYKPIIISKKPKLKLGNSIDVKIIKTTKYDLRAEIDNS
jgi:threonylcarbamoyladenosine tRNA methylthiotransferase CDKAL1